MIASFLSSIVSFLLFGVGTYTCNTLTKSMITATGLETLGLIASYPLLIILFVITFIACICCLISSAKCISSHITVIKVLGIVLFLSSIAGLVLNVINVIKLF